MRKIAYLNPISDKGTALWTEDYEKTEEFTQADAVMVRSAAMHDLDLPDNLAAIARAGAGVNNIPLERCAEEGIFVGEYVNGQYFFSPDTPVSRSQFLAMAMSVAGLEPLEQVNVTGFADDISIPTWTKGYVSSALKAGVIHGTRDEQGQIVFCPDTPVTRAEATVMLNNLLNDCVHICLSRSICSLLQQRRNYRRSSSCRNHCYRRSSCC